MYQVIFFKFWHKCRFNLWVKLTAPMDDELCVTTYAHFYRVTLNGYSSMEHIRFNSVLYKTVGRDIIFGTVRSLRIYYFIRVESIDTLPTNSQKSRTYDYSSVFYKKSW